MTMKKTIDKAVKEILAQAKPISIFLYGSYNTPDYIPGKSDLEIGILRKNPDDAKSKDLRRIAEKYSNKNLTLRIYPYDLAGFKKGQLKTPFTKSVFVRHTILTAKTIWGDEVIEKLPLPAVTLLDAYREASFTTMRALSALFFLRAGNLKESQEMFYKSCLFSVLSLSYLQGKFPIGFKEIVKTSKKLNLTLEEKRLINKAYQLRQGKTKPSTEEMYNLIFASMNFSSQTVELRIKEMLERKGDKIIVK